MITLRLNGRLGWFVKGVVNDLEDLREVLLDDGGLASQSRYLDPLAARFRQVDQQARVSTL